MSTQPTPGAVMTLNEHTYGGALVCPMNCTRSTVRTQTVTVLGPVAYEPSMTRVRTADGTARRCMSDDLTAVEVAR